MKTSFLALYIVFTLQLTYGQNSIQDSVYSKKSTSHHFKYTPLIIPTTFVAYGLIGLNSCELKKLNLDIQSDVMKSNPAKVTIDDYLQYAPAISVYGLNSIGIQGKNNFKDRTVLLGASLLFVFVSVTALKKITKIERPDKSAANSFPSGHTALAFAGAEFMYQEYKEVSIWYGISAYAVASTTGVLRIYNNKHWFTDVVAGAGFGILSTKVAYWMAPYLNKHIFPSMTGKSTAFLSPTFDGENFGGAFIWNF
jgi:hypothetical protein